MNPQLTCSQRQWLHSSVGRASHRYREVTGSNPVEVLNFFQASLRNCINCVHCDDHFFIFISFPQFIYDLFHISLTLSVHHVSRSLFIMRIKPMLCVLVTCQALSAGISKFIWGEQCPAQRDQ